MKATPEQVERPGGFVFLGWFEEYWDANSSEFLGTRRILEPDRPMGSDGLTEMNLIAPLELDRGLKKVRLRAGLRTPRHVRSILNPLCGKSIPSK